MLSRWLDAERTTVLPRLLAGMAVFGWLLSQALGPGDFDVSGEPIGADFLALWTGARLAGTGGDPLDFAAQHAMQVAELGPAVRLHAWVSPPWTAVLLAPLGALPYLWALAVWWGLCAVLWLLSLRELSRDLNPGRGPEGILLAMCFFPTLAAGFYGQATPMWTALFAMGVVSWRRGRSLTAGLLLASLVLKPQLLLPAVVWGVGRRDVPFLGGLTLGCLVWMGIAEVFDPGGSAEWWQRVPAIAAMLRSDAYPVWGHVSALGWWTNALNGLAPSLVEPLVSATGLALAGVATWLAAGAGSERRSPRSDRHLAAALAVALMALPHLYLYDLGILVVPLALAAHGHGTRPDRPLDGGRFLVATAVLWLATFAGPYATLAMDGASRAWLGFPLAICVVFPVVLGWAWVTVTPPQGKR